MRDNELPDFIHIGSILGLTLLGISIILFIVFMILYGNAYDNNVSLSRNAVPKGHTALMVSYIVVGVLGFIMCFLIPYGHYLKSFNDPSVISSLDGYHFETTDTDKGIHKATEVIPHSDYKGVGSLGSNLITNNIKSNLIKKDSFTNDSNFL